VADVGGTHIGNCPAGVNALIYSCFLGTSRSLLLKFSKSDVWYHHTNIMLFNVNKKVQLDATVCRHLFTAQSLYMFRVSQHPSSGVLKTVSATSGIGHDTGTATAVAVPVS